jgi:hypothetical protein
VHSLLKSIHLAASVNLRKVSTLAKMYVLLQGQQSVHKLDTSPLSNIISKVSIIELDELAI